MTAKKQRAAPELRIDTITLDSLPNLRRFAGALDSSNIIEEEPATICTDVLRAAHSEIPRLEARLAASRASSRTWVETMLGVISYCYAKGVFNSGEIEHRLWLDAAFIEAFANEIPSAQAIRAFRRRHRENILAIIEQALQQYARRASSPRAVPADRDAADPASKSLRLEAQRLLDMANIMDQLAAD